MEMLEINKVCKIATGDNKDVLQVFHPIGQGGTCDIFYATFNDQKCAIKVLKGKQKYGSKKKYKSTKANLYSESRTLENLSHPFIVSLLRPSAKGKLLSDYGADSTHFFLLELLEGGELITYAQTEPLREDELRLYGLQVVEGLLYLHAKGWAHRDVKPDNIVLSKDLAAAKLIDFGFCTPLESDHELLAKGTAEYLSPELNAMVPSDLAKADVFALGVTFFGLLTGHFPCLRVCTQYDPFYRLLCERKYEEFWKKMCRKVTLSEECKVLLQDMLSPSPSRRPSMQKLKEYPWFGKKGKSKEEIIKGMNKRKMMLEGLKCIVCGN
eukprot:TRINITY_DN13883_c0_g1_i4.p1 TRINITY_DN13883_c0_g1~~TRINITY_DN13883_c0_g1_i4.p1  ORF type:complete len:325 (-),score=98.65 TRINITY_DN13883_c0_g1_i4:187-1161(-)